MKLLKNICILFFLLTGIFGCTQKANRINIAGSTTALPVIQAAAEIYTERYPDIDISVRGGGSGIGIKSVIDRIVDIGSSSREVNKHELDVIDKKKLNLNEIPIAKDGITVIVNKKNKVKNLSLKQLKDIYSGKISNWKDVGGADQVIVVISRDVSSGSFEVFNTAVLDNKKLMQNTMRLASNNAVVTSVGYTPGAIGYIGLGYINDDINIVKIDNVYPSKTTIFSGEYKISRKLFMYTSENPNHLTQQFISFVLSEEGQKIVEQQGYVRIK